MKKCILMTILFSIQTTFASSFSLSECLEQANDYGGSNKVEESCFSTILLQKETISIVDNGLEAYAYKNMLYFKDGDNVRLISGSNSKLNNIQAIDLKKSHKMIAVLNQDSEGKSSLMIFNSTRNGNVGPRKIISTNQTEAAQDIQLTSNGEKVFLLHNDRLTSYSTNMDSRSPRVNEKPVVLNQFGSDSLPLDEPGNSVFNNDYLFNLNKKTQKVFVYKLSDHSHSTPSFVLNTEENNSRSPASISLSDDGTSLIIEDNEKGNVPIKLNNLK